MFPCVFECITPADIQPHLYQEIVELHQRSFKIPAKLIIHLLKQRELVILYRDISSKKLIGTAGLEWIEKEELVAYYMGNVVVDQDYRRIGIFSHAHLYAMELTFLKFPLQRGFCSGFATTLEAYSWMTNIPHYWPQPGVKISPAVMDFMAHIAEKTLGPDHCRIENGVIIGTKIASELKRSRIENIHTTPLSSEDSKSFFYVANPNAAQGEQLMMMFPITRQAVATVLGLLLRNNMPAKKLASHLIHPFRKPSSKKWETSLARRK